MISKVLTIYHNFYITITLGFIYKHDGSRILQTCLKYGTTEQKKKVLDELLPETLNIAQHEFSHFLAIKIFHYSDQKQRMQYVNSFISVRCGAYLSPDSSTKFKDKFSVFSSTSSELQSSKRSTRTATTRSASQFSLNSMVASLLCSNRMRFPRI